MHKLIHALKRFPSTDPPTLMLLLVPFLDLPASHLFSLSTQCLLRLSTTKFQPLAPPHTELRRSMSSQPAPPSTASHWIFSAASFFSIIDPNANGKA
jgi:hypothetical protein